MRPRVRIAPGVPEFSGRFSYLGKSVFLFSRKYLNLPGSNPGERYQSRLHPIIGIKMRVRIIIILALITVSCNINHRSNNKINIHKQTGEMMNDTVPKVTGIGGIFFRSENPTKIREWYGKNLGLAIDDFGSPFEFRNANNPEEINYLRWTPFEKSTDYFAPSRKEFMINYRVQNIEALVIKLKENGVTIVDEIEAFEYGKFVHIMDPEGNKIELWEPIDSFFTKMGGATTR
jgi:predicted enzyme related to lactoylglutathione lyase